ncbi:hypothetical protein ACIOD2_43995 [Amycolatopsis sp. NPDC088138]|uniref:hypothetical protein n=1 Tax=Amycolatopsis sp. NPDC088138 TaxID=3363938 RepID=UPI003801E5F3
MRLTLLGLAECRAEPGVDVRPPPAAARIGRRPRMGEASRAIVAGHDLDGALNAFEGQYRILLGLPEPSAANEPAVA